ncbi:sugar transferase [Cloacibacterium rupense]|uniref:Sugar transferase n=1 Tax=Cloacibacterium rupense TaxID=517423 RepID=A0ABQ2NN66_9FLAO|nr:sugar transferase [Cloacibacterium rupense]GGP06560.1 sugar transferase [Cloacibacterium rupense]
MYRNYFKPLADRLLAFIGIVVLSPILIGASIVLFFSNRGKVFFLQERPGKNGRIFKIIKFRTMNDARDHQGILLSDEERTTTMGKIIRSSSIDELPQLFNVLIGNMSLIGPRPLLPEYLELYTPRQQKRHLVKPGITGWAQINGRNAVEWDKKLEFDVWYVENINIILDLQIFFLTFIKVFKIENVHGKGVAHTPNIVLENNE